MCYKTNIINTKKANMMDVWTVIVLSNTLLGMFLSYFIIKNKQILKIKSHSKIEPSWLPHTPVILYTNGFCISEFCHTVTREKSDIMKPYVRRMYENNINRNWNKPKRQVNLYFLSLFIAGIFAKIIVKIDDNKANKSKIFPVSAII